MSARPRGSRDPDGSTVISFGSADRARRTVGTVADSASRDAEPASAADAASLTQVSRRLAEMLPSTKFFLAETGDWAPSHDHLPPRPVPSSFAHARASAAADPAWSSLPSGMPSLLGLRRAHAQASPSPAPAPSSPTPSTQPPAKVWPLPVSAVFPSAAAPLPAPSPVVASVPAPAPAPGPAAEDTPKRFSKRAAVKKAWNSTLEWLGIGGPDAPPVVSAQASALGGGGATSSTEEEGDAAADSSPAAALAAHPRRQTDVVDALLANRDPAAAAALGIDIAPGAAAGGGTGGVGVGLGEGPAPTWAHLGAKSGRMDPEQLPAPPVYLTHVTKGYGKTASAAAPATSLSTSSSSRSRAAVASASAAAAGGTALGIDVDTAPGDDDDDDDEVDDGTDPAQSALRGQTYSAKRYARVDGTRLATIQRAYDVFEQLDLDKDNTLGVDDLERGLNMFDPERKFSPQEVKKIFDTADTTRSGRLLFAEFYSVFACLTLLVNRFGLTNETFLTPSQVQSALKEAGLSPTPAQLKHMLNVKSGDSSGQKIDFHQILRIYMAAPRTEGELFLHSWYQAGRTNFLHHRSAASGVSPIQDLIAGTAAGVALTIVGHPFDTVKVRMQTANRFKSAMDVVLKTTRHEGALALFKGMGSPMATIPLINAAVFASYAQGREYFLKRSGSDELTLGEIGLAGAYAGLLNSWIVGPVELIKTRLQIQYSENTRLFAGPLDCIQHILKASGVKGIFRGMTATIYREVPGYAGQFLAYEALKRQLVKFGNRAEAELTAVELLSAGGLAGMASWCCSYPMDYIKSQIQAEPYNKPTAYKKNPYLLDGGFWSCWRQTVQAKGYSELWRGFGVCLLRAWPANAAGFLAYETVMNLIRDSPTLAGATQSTAVTAAIAAAAVDGSSTSSTSSSSSSSPSSSSTASLLATSLTPAVSKHA